MAATAAECRELIEIAEEKNLTLMVGHTFLYSSPVRQIKQIVDSGDIGQIRYISSRRLNLGLFQKDINVVWDLAPHDLSIITYIMGQPPSAVNCSPLIAKTHCHTQAAQDHCPQRFPQADLVHFCLPLCIFNLPCVPWLQITDEFQQ